MHNTHSFIINSSSLTLLVLLIPLFGLISDHLGRTKTVLMGCITLSLLSLPYFSVLSLGNFYQILVAHTMMAIPCASIFAVTPVLITEIFPLSIRCSITNLIYSVAACIGGGITPLIAFKLVQYESFLPGSILVILGGVNIFFLAAYMRRKHSLPPRLVLVNE